MARKKKTSLSSPSRRQVNLVYQAGGLLIDNDGRQTEAPEGSSTTQESLTASPVSITPTSVGEMSSTAQPSSKPSTTQIPADTQTSDVSPSLDSFAQQAAQVSFLIAPTTLINLPTESNPAIPMSSTLPSSTISQSLQITSTQMTTSSSSTHFSLSTPSSLLPQGVHSSTSSAYVILSSSSSSPVSAISPTAASLSASGHHTSEFYIGTIFLAIVAVALAVSFMAWFVRSRRRSLSCCLSRDKHDGEDMEKQDLGFGLGFYLGDSMSSSTKLPPSSLDEKHWFPPPPPHHTTYSPYLATKPVRAYLGSVESLKPSFGALRIKNLVSGDMYSSGDEMSRPASRVGYELGTPREAVPGSTPRFLGLDGTGLEVPWGPVHLRSACSPSHVSVLQSPSRRSLTAKEEGLSKNWEGLPPLPAPAFAHGSTASRPAVQDGWGATIRSGFRSALSVMTGAQIAKTSPPVGDDYFTSMPTRPSRSISPRSGSISSRRPRSRASAHEDPFRDLSVGNAAASYSHEPFGPGAGLSGDFSQEVARAVETPPLVIRKKSHAIGRRGSNDSTRSEILLSPGGIYRARSIHSPAGISDTVCSLGLGVTRKHSTMPIRSKLSSSVRPPVLKRGSTSGFSDASLESEASQALTEEEMAVKHFMRARRTTASEVEGHF